MIRSKIGSKHGHRLSYGHHAGKEVGIVNLLPTNDHPIVASFKESGMSEEGDRYVEVSNPVTQSTGIGHTWIIHADDIELPKDMENEDYLSLLKKEVQE